MTRIRKIDARTVRKFPAVCDGDDDCRNSYTPYEDEWGRRYCLTHTPEM